MQSSPYDIFLLSYSMDESKYWCFSIDFLFNVDWSLEASKWDKITTELS